MKAARVPALVFLFLASAYLAAQPAQHPEVTGAERVLIFNDGAAKAAAASVVGEGIDFGAAVKSQPRSAANGLTILWKQYRSDDAGEMRHVFYRQYLRDEKTQRETPLVGGYMTLHFRNGVLTSVLGTQFSSARLTNRPVFDKIEATRRARDAMAQRPDFRAEPAAALTPAVLADRAKESELLLMSSGNGVDFHYVYFTLVFGENGRPFEVYLNAENAAAESFQKGDLDSCPHPPTTSILGTGPTQNPNVSGGSRNVWANSPGNVPGFPYDAIASCSNFFNCGVAQVTTDPIYMCDPTANVSYTVFPVSAVPGAYFQNDATWKGAIATDASAFTRSTFNAFTYINQYFMTVNYFPGDKWVVIEAGGFDSATYGRFATSINPADSAIISQRTFFPYTFAASLDVIAHEFGHMVCTKKAGWPTTGVGLQLQEGFSDVIGAAVEQNRQPAGWGAETRDWDIGEDTVGSSYLRSGSRNDGDNGHTLANGLFANNRWHRLDTANPTSDPHDIGNAALVAFRLLAEGGQNGFCTAHQIPTCTTALTGVGVSKASRIMLDAVWFYGYPSQTWNDVAVGAIVAARDEYSQSSPPNACTEQDQVIKAFTVIGYPPTNGADGPPYGC